MRTVGMFLGAETASWSLQQFTDTAAKAKNLGCTALAVKCADGSIVWYDSQGGLSAVRSACLKGGLDMLPYMYSYGNKFGALTQEIEVCKRLMQLRPDNAAMVDMEVEWNGHVDWATTWRGALAPVPGILYLTTWGNPAGQNWDGVIAAIRACINIWVPQEYDTYLVSTESQYPSDLHIQPALNLPEAWPGPNDPVAAAKTALSRGHDGVWLWEYQLAVQHPDVVRQIAAVMNGTPAATTGGSSVSIIIDKDGSGNIIGAHSDGNHVGAGMAIEIDKHPDWLDGTITVPETYLASGESCAVIRGGAKELLTYTRADGVSLYGGDAVEVVNDLYNDRQKAQAQVQTSQAALDVAQTQIKDLQAQIAALKASAPTTDPHAAAALKIIQAIKALEGQIA